VGSPLDILGSWQKREKIEYINNKKGKADKLTEIEKWKKGVTQEIRCRD
jgi:hypothetical protein